MLRLTFNSLLMLVLFTLLLGMGYPLVVTAAAQLLFHDAASGHLIEQKGKVIGAEMLGQHFTRPGYFWGRPSETQPPYNPAASAASNLGPTNPKLKEAVAARKAALEKTPHNGAPPVDLLLSSASGLDPHISLEAALWQVPRVAAARNMPPASLETLVRQTLEERQFGVLGEPRVNVLKLNLLLDGGHD